MKKEGYARGTIKATAKRLRRIARNVNIDDPEAVKSYIAKKNTRAMLAIAKSFFYNFISPPLSLPSILHTTCTKDLRKNVL